MKRPLLTLLTLFLWQSPLISKGQSSVWLGLRTKSELSNKWGLATFSETRYRLNKLSPERAFTEVSPSRKLGEHLAFATPIRFTAFENPNKRSHEVRLGIQVIANTNFSDLVNFKYRSFYQWDKSIDGKGFQKAYWRHKVDLKRAWNPKFSSQVEQEFWHDFTEKGKIDRYRLILSNSLAVKSTARIYIGYLTQSPIFKGYTSFEHIAVLRYQMSI